MARMLQVSKTRVQKEPGNSKIKKIEFEGFPGSVRMGIHGGIAQFFGLKPDEPLPSTLDYVVAAVSGCLAGTVAGVLEARSLPSDLDHLQTRAEGRIEEVDGKMLLTHISVHYRMKVAKEKRPNVEKALQGHEDRCPVSASIRRGITIECHAEIEDE